MNSPVVDLSKGRCDTPDGFIIPCADINCKHHVPPEREIKLTLKEHIESINHKLCDGYDQICDESSRRCFEYLLKDIDYEIDQKERRKRSVG